MKKVGVVMGSASDMSVMEATVETLRQFGVPVEVRVLSAHRTPDDAIDFARNAAGGGFGVVIAAAGRAAHLAGVLAAATPLPVIGVPIASGSLDGLDSLLAMVQMPSGVPVATVAVDGAKNAALLAVRILALADDTLAKALDADRDAMADAVRAADAKIRETYSEHLTLLTPPPAAQGPGGPGTRRPRDQLAGSGAGRPGREGWPPPTGARRLVGHG